MTRRTVASLQSDLSTGGSSSSRIETKLIKDLSDSYLDLDTHEQSLAGNGATKLNTEQLLWKKIGADMNVTTDQALTKIGTYTNFLITRIRVVNASISLTTAAGGVYNTAAKGGTALVAAGQAYSTLTAATIGLDLTLAAIANGLRSDASLILSLTTGQGAPATADFYVVGIPLS